MRRATLVGFMVLATLSGCRRKHAPVTTDEPTAPTAEATAPVTDRQPTTRVDELPPPPPPAPLPGHPPTDDELRAKLKPLFPEIGRCISEAGAVKAPEKYLQLRFSISPAGSVIAAELEGHDAARGCVNEVLRAFHTEPWTGPPSIITMPLTHAGEPVPESAFATDAGAR